MKDKTLDYYNENAEEFFTSTKDANMEELYRTFISYIPSGGHILDLGCGSGRDSKHFIEMGYNVIAIDGSKELCELASAYIGKEVHCMDFKDIDYDNLFDGVWACASLLHVDKESIEDVLAKVYKSIKTNGVLYVSFKEGMEEREHKGRFFNDYTEETLRPLLESSGFKVEKMFITGDVREGRASEKWVNAIARK